MIFKKLFGLGFLTIMLFAFLGLFVGPARESRTNEAYRQGYIDGQQTAASEEGIANTVPPASAYGYDTHRRWHSGFFPGPLLLCLLPFMFFGLMSMMFGCKSRHWKHEPHGPEHWHQHGPWKGNAKPVWDDDEFTSEPPKEA
jgi:hypothetical protein